MGLLVQWLRPRAPRAGIPGQGARSHVAAAKDAARCSEGGRPRGPHPGPATHVLKPTGRWWARGWQPTQAAAARPGLTARPRASLGICSGLRGTDLGAPSDSRGEGSVRAWAASEQESGREPVLCDAGSCTRATCRSRAVGSQGPTSVSREGVTLAQPLRHRKAWAHPREAATRSPVDPEGLTHPTRVPQQSESEALLQRRAPSCSMPRTHTAPTCPQGARPQPSGDRRSREDRVCGSRTLAPGRREAPVCSWGRGAPTHHRPGHSLPLGLAQRLQKESPGRLSPAWPEAHGPAERPVVADGTSVWVCLFVGTEDVPSLLWERRVPPAA